MRTLPARALDSVDLELDAWMAELPGVDPETEAARMRLLRLGRQLERAYARTAQRFGMTLGDWEALSVLRRSGRPYQLPPTVLAQALAITSGTMSVRVDRLLSAGLIEQVEDESDGRSRPVRLTPLGHHRWRAATAARTDIERTLIGETLGRSRLEQLNKLLRRLMLGLENSLGPAPRRPDAGE
jgi:DNA-binding MarR family transcriptional regulator